MSGSSLSGHEPISMDVEIGEWVTNSRRPMSTRKEGVPPTNLLVRCERLSGRVSGMRTGMHICFSGMRTGTHMCLSGFHPLRPNNSRDMILSPYRVVVPPK